MFFNIIEFHLINLTKKNKINTPNILSVGTRIYKPECITRSIYPIR